MKDNKLDELFKQGLQDHKLTPPSAAWDRIEANVAPKKSKRGFYILSIAASICLVCVASWLFVQNSQNSDSELTAKTEATTPKVEADTKAANATDAAEEKEEQNAIQPIAPATQQVLVAQQQTKQTKAAPFKQDPSLIQPSFEGSQRVLIASLEPAQLQARNAKPALKFSILMNSRVSEFVTASFKYTNDESLMNKKKFSLMNGIVSVAKGVNEGTKAISEMRKSKIEFVNSELKYGADEQQAPDELEQRQEK
ncbi:hypothetical protein BXY85_0998 [Roseivirga pacifica]|uniref:Uncharacterized protein n=1 Tax=Roseivirga pacifica TaxID=1267423 RepID=A0A1I0RPT2_9BACT|nr:hypothetical protein [Roseivirga pacifica]RKQ49995.1 hypothetical protein BXY85_0998 [Roseivirga pacifica]SEW43210.1 hypothetical protein SAMN05216290_3946 [Roseivirga pacifica]